MYCGLSNVLSNNRLEPLASALSAKHLVTAAGAHRDLASAFRRPEAIIKFKERRHCDQQSPTGSGEPDIAQLGKRKSSPERASTGLA